jgi:hypothetical protein
MEYTPLGLQASENPPQPHVASIEGLDVSGYPLRNHCTGSFEELFARLPIKRIPIATVAMAYDCPTSSATFDLSINEALYFGESLKFSLLSPNQLRDSDVHVDERHRQHTPDSIFGIYVPAEPLTIQFDLDGVIAGFDTRLPSQAEVDNVTLATR